MQKLSSQDRSVLIRFASSLPSGSPEKKAILAGLQSSKVAGVDVLPDAPSGHHWEEEESGAYVLYRGTKEVGSIAQNGSRWLAFVPEDQDSIGRGQKDAGSAANQLLENLGFI